MAVRDPLIIVSGLFQELNTSSDKLNLDGNTTADLAENTNLYYTNARARGAVSATDSGGLGSFTYTSGTGVFEYTGPSDADVRGKVSVASGEGLTYNSSTGVLGTSAIPNTQLANSSVTIGSTAVALGATVTNFTGIGSLTSTVKVSSDVLEASSYVRVGTDGEVGGVRLEKLFSTTKSAVTFEGATADDFETSLTVTDPTADRTITLPDASGTVALTSDLVVTASSTTTFSNKSIALGSNTVTGTTAQFNTALTDGDFATLAGTESLTNKSLTAPVLNATSATVAGKILFKEGTDNGTNTVTLLGAASTADVTITLPAETGTVLTSASSIANGNLANSTVTIGSSAVSLGATLSSIAGLTSLTSAAVVTDDDGFRVRDNTDNTKQLAFECSSIATGTTRTLTIPDQSGTIALVGGGATEFLDNVFRVQDNADNSKELAFECSGISSSTTRTMTVPNENGTISTESFATAIAVALG
tara:strand:+ start:8955 stop:10382 length:1428 start_codon:yes stop_codon:yes gene_type:complete